MSVGIGILTWNNSSGIDALLRSIADEKCLKIVVDNCSEDNTKDIVSKYQDVKLIELDSNKGISIAKNIYINEIIKHKCEYLLMLDNDVTVMKNSIAEMRKYMEKNSNTACIGQFIDNRTSDMSKEFTLPSHEDWSIKRNVLNGLGTVRTWTHYAMYRTNLFDSVKFDENGPFGSPGYGFDDDDLGMQIAALGYDIDCFDETCCHAASGSVGLLNQKYNSIFYNERKQYFLEKWNLI